MEILYAYLIENLRRNLEALEARIIPWLVCYSVTILRVGLGSIFLGFGLLKFFPGFSPAEELVMQTLGVLSFGLVPVRVGVVLVAALECAIGLGLITGRFLRPSLALLGFQMVGAMSPLVLFPSELFGGPFYAPTLEGQYVLKDVVLISAGLVIGTTLQGGRLVSGHAHRPVANRGHARNTPSKTTRRQLYRVGSVQRLGKERTRAQAGTCMTTRVRRDNAVPIPLTRSHLCRKAIPE